MATDQLGPFADAELVLRLMLDDALADEVRVVSATGPELIPPVVLVRRIGGRCDRVTDFAVMLVSCFGATRPESNVLAAEVQAAILNAVNKAVPLPDDVVALIDGTVVQVADHPDLYENPDVRMVSASFELRMRRPRLTA